MLRNLDPNTTARCVNTLRLRFALAMATLLGIAVPPSGRAQTFQVIYTLTGGTAAEHPIAGLTLDAQGNLYGTSAWGGTKGDGTVFELRRTKSSFVYSTLHSFINGTDGAFPWDAVTLASDGSLYGTTGIGGTGDNGTIFRLEPPAKGCTESCVWTETVLYRFAGSSGRNPQAGVIFDRKGNLYGTTANGGSDSDGVVYELSPAGGSWDYKVLYAFTGGDDGAYPGSPLMLDSAGNLYGTASAGGLPGCEGFGCGTVFQLKPSQAGWKEHTLYSFLDGTDGAVPTAGLISDGDGNMYGATCCGQGTGGTIFELSPSGGNWTFNLAYDAGGSGPGPVADLVRDSAGNLYGASWGNGLYGQGVVFKLTPSNGGWIYTSLHDFTGGSDGANAEGGLVMDSSGNLYGTTYQGGNKYAGVVYEITP